MPPQREGWCMEGAPSPCLPTSNHIGEKIKSIFEPLFHTLGVVPFSLHAGKLEACFPGAAENQVICYLPAPMLRAGLVTMTWRAVPSGKEVGRRKQKTESRFKCWRNRRVLKPYYQGPAAAASGVGRYCCGRVLRVQFRDACSGIWLPKSQLKNL